MIALLNHLNAALGALVKLGFLSDLTLELPLVQNHAELLGDKLHKLLFGGSPASGGLMAHQEDAL